MHLRLRPFQRSAVRLLINHPQLMKNDYAKFQATAKEWTKK